MSRDSAVRSAMEQNNVQIDFDDELPETEVHDGDNFVAPRPEEQSRLAHSPSLPLSKRFDDRRLDLRRHGALEQSTEHSPSRLNDDCDIIAGADDDLDEDEVEGHKRSRRRRKKLGVMAMGTEDMLNKVTGLLSRMDAAAENDIESNIKRQPAIEKIKMLDEVEEACIHRDLQRMLLTEGLLGALKAWIEPLTDGTLPNIKIRTTVLRILQKLPIDTGNDSDRANLKNSKIGSRVMFLSRIQDETTENKRMASELVQKWSRPIFEEARRYDEEERIQHALSARKRRMESERLEEEKRKSLKPGDPEFKYVASRPQPNRDYVIKPKSRVDAAMIPGQKKSAVIQKINKFKRRSTKKGL